MTDSFQFLHHRIDCAPLQWNDVAKAIVAQRGAIEKAGGVLYGIWRSQIGQPRDALNVMTAWPDAAAGSAAFVAVTAAVAGIAAHHVTTLVPTLRPQDATPPLRQGNFAFRWFETPVHHWSEFLDLCTEAWPGFEESYDSQVIGLWKEPQDRDGVVRSLLLTRRPDLAMWERSKIPQGAAEEAVRAKLNRRYDICNSTYVYTTTLLTAEDREDRARWT